MSLHVQMIHHPLFFLFLILVLGLCCKQVTLASTFLDQGQFLQETLCSAYHVASCLKEHLSRWFLAYTFWHLLVQWFESFVNLMLWSCIAFFTFKLTSYCQCLDLTNWLYVPVWFWRVVIRVDKFDQTYQGTIMFNVWTYKINSSKFFIRIIIVYGNSNISEVQYNYCLERQ